MHMCCSLMSFPVQAGVGVSDSDGQLGSSLCDGCVVLGKDMVSDLSTIIYVACTSAAFLAL